MYLGRGVIAGVVVVLAYAASLANPSPALAYRTPANPVSVEANWSTTWQRTVNGSYVPFPCEVELTCNPAQKERIGRARRAANALPRLRTLGTLTLGVGAFQLGWKIGRTIDTLFLDLGGEIARKPADGVWTENPHWIFVDGLTLATPDDSKTGWWLHFSTPDCTSYPLTWYWVVDGVANDNFICKDNVLNETQAAVEAALALGTASGLVEIVEGETGKNPLGGGEWPCTQSGYVCRAAFIPEAAMEAELGANEKPVPWVAQPVGATTNIADPSTPPAWGSSQQEEVVEILLEDEAQAEADAGTPEEEETTAWQAGNGTDPEWEGYPEPEVELMTLLQPLPNETYTAYITRLQTAGYVGTVTEVELTTALEGYGPEAPARITIPGNTPGTTRTLDPLLWPSTAPQIELDAPITVRFNPNTAPPVAEETPPGEGGIPPVDFTPLTELDGACSFPFGFICYAQDVTEWFNVTPDAPRFEFGYPEVSVAGTDYGGGEETWAVDLEVMDAYMTILRTLISVALWIGAVYFLAVRLLGFNAGGDPGEAADEAYDWR